jgi:hypothetical protein
MGMTHCSRHGRQRIDFASASLVGRIEAGQDVDGLWLPVMFLGEIRFCAIDGKFAEDKALERTVSGDFDLISDEDRVWTLLDALKPVCGVCLEEARQRMASAS